MAPALGKASELIFVKVSIAGVEVDALVDTGATMSCCRWEWYQKWKDHLGSSMKSSVRIIGVGHDPIKVKGLSKPLTLQWDGVGGQFQLMVLAALTDVEVVLGMDVISQFDVKINFKNQIASPAREPCTPLGHREVHRIWTISDSKIKTKDKRKYRRIVSESTMPWDKAGYKAQLQKDLEDIRQKLNRVLGPDKRIEGRVLVDLCMQRSGRRESGCDAPNASEELPTPVASPPRSPTPPAAQVRQYSWRHYAKNEVCFYIHTLNPLKARQKSERENQQYSVIRDNTERRNLELNQLVHVSQYANNIHTLKPLKARKEEDELKFKCPGSTSCQHHSDVIVSDVIVNKPVARKQCAQKKHSLMSKKGFLKSTLSVCSQTFTKVALMLAVVISILGGVLNVKLPGRISTIGTSSLVCQ